jgi:plasmid stabilization system protein ParE
VKTYRISIEPEAGHDLESIYAYISSKDSVSRAQRFLHKLQIAINSLNYMPERFRKSIYMNDGKTHDMVVHGYTICYHVLEETVHVVAVFRQREL